jgi:hypothetical protein
VSPKQAERVIQPAMFRKLSGCSVCRTTNTNSLAVLMLLVSEKGKPMWKFIVAIVLVLAFSDEVTAQTNFMVTGNELHEACKDKRNSFCLEYIIGATDGFVGGAIAAKRKASIKFCLPDSVTRKQLRDSTTNWLEDHPKERRYNAVLLIIRALNSAWPCPVKRPTNNWTIKAQYHGLLTERTN